MGENLGYFREERVTDSMTPISTEKVSFHSKIEELTNHQNIALRKLERLMTELIERMLRAALRTTVHIGQWDALESIFGGLPWALRDFPFCLFLFI